MCSCCRVSTGDWSECELGPRGLPIGVGVETAEETRSLAIEAAVAQTSAVVPDLTTVDAVAVALAAAIGDELVLTNCAENW